MKNDGSQKRKVQIPESRTQLAQTVQWIPQRARARGVGVWFLPRIEPNTPHPGRYGIVSWLLETQKSRFGDPASSIADDIRCCGTEDFCLLIFGEQWRDVDRASQSRSSFSRFALLNTINARRELDALGRGHNDRHVLHLDPCSFAHVNRHQVGRDVGPTDRRRGSGLLPLNP